MARCQIPFSFFYPATVDAATVNEPVSGTSITVTNRDNGNPTTLYSSETGAGTITSLLTNASGTVPSCWVIEGSYLIVAAALGSFAGATVAWEAVRGDGVGNVAAGAIGTAQILAGAVTSVQLAAGAAAANLGAGSVSATDLASGAAATNVGALTGGVITGTLPNLGIGSAQVTAAKLASGAAASNVGSLGGGLQGTLPNPTLSAANQALLVPNFIGYTDVASTVYTNTTPAAISPLCSLTLTAPGIINNAIGHSGSFARVSAYVQCELQSLDGTGPMSVTLMIDGVAGLSVDGTTVLGGTTPSYPGGGYVQAVMATSGFGYNTGWAMVSSTGGSPVPPVGSYVGPVSGQMLGAPIDIWLDAGSHTIALYWSSPTGSEYTVLYQVLTAQVFGG